MQPANVSFRGYRRGDVSAMYALDLACFERSFRFSRSAMRRFAEAENATVVLAEKADELAGFVILHVEEAHPDRIGYIVTLDVEPRSRRKGIARALMEAAEQQARLQRCGAMLLHVFTGNQPAIQFYARLGYVRSHREPNFYGAGKDAWVCYRSLAPETS